MFDFLSSCKEFFSFFEFFKLTITGLNFFLQNLEFQEFEKLLKNTLAEAKGTHELKNEV
jgi:hypothetical protein